MQSKLFLLFISLTISTYGYSFIKNNQLDSMSYSSQDSVRHLQMDSAMRAQLSDLRRITFLIDSSTQVRELLYQYIIVKPDRPNQLFESIKDSLIISDGNFMRWIAFTNSLSKDKYIAPQIGAPKIYRPAWVFFTVFGLILCLGLIRLLFPVDFFTIIQAYYKDRLLLQVSKEDNMVTSWPYVFLFVLFSFTLALFILVYQSSLQGMAVLQPHLYLKITGSIAILFMLKILIIRVISYVFELQSISREYIAIIYLMYFNSMLILMPFLLTMILVPIEYFDYLLLAFSLIAIILFFYRILRTGFHLFANMRFSIFYLILYLCSLEIAPILILVKTLSK